MPIGVVLAPLVLALCSPPSRPLIAEVFYDAVGDDTGFEFVELHNPTRAPVALAGLTLEVGDGAGPGRWTARWTAGVADSIPAGGRFLIGGARVTPSPQVVVQLDLQNGPDAVRIVWPDGAIEVVGYGTLALGEYFCGAPAPDVPAGQSLARVPDASDLGSNAQDFRAATPSPGAANRPGRDASLLEGSLSLTPEQPAPGGEAALAGTVVNHGAELIADRELELRVSESRMGGEAELTSSFVDRQLMPGDSAGFHISLPGLGAGKRVLRVRARLAGDETPANDADSLPVRVGPGPLEISEIQFHPAAGEGEWVEVRNRSAADVAVAGFTLADRRGAPGAPSGGEDSLAPESLAVLAQDRIALLARFPALAAARVWEVKPWASLNNSNDSTGVADVVTLRERDGTPCERVAYSAAGVPAGVPIERRADGGWGIASDPGGTPLAPPRALPPLAGRFALSPRRVRGSSAPASLAWQLPWPRGRIAVDLYDLAGRHVSQVLPETAVAGRGERAWSTGELPPGLYVMVLLARGESEGATLTATQPLRVEGGTR